MPIPDLPQAEVAIVEMTNAIRKEHNLGAVKPDPELQKAARAYAKFLATSTKFSHNADGRQPADRAKAAGYEPCFVSENLSSNLDTRGFETRQLARQAVQGWFNSPGHRKNLLTEDVTDVGVGIAKAPGEQRFISVQLFGRPLKLSYNFRINNASGRTVVYQFRNENFEIKSRYSARHSACFPGEITFRLPDAPKEVIGRYKARDGDVFVLRRQNDGVKIDVTQSSGAAR